MVPAGSNTLGWDIVAGVGHWRRQGVRGAQGAEVTPPPGAYNS